jgi:uncharacterized radical SAM superfamily Fe-S cluster-containing enzyme
MAGSHDLGTHFIIYARALRPPLWCSGQHSLAQTQRRRVWFSTLPDFLRIGGSGTGFSQPRDDNKLFTYPKSWLKCQRLRISICRKLAKRGWVHRLQTSCYKTCKIIFTDMNSTSALSMTTLRGNCSLLCWDCFPKCPRNRPHLDLSHTQVMNTNYKVAYRILDNNDYEEWCLLGCSAVELL